MSSKTFRGFSGIIQLVSSVEENITTIKEVRSQPSTTAPRPAQNENVGTTSTSKRQIDAVNYKQSSNNGIVIIGTIVVAFVMIFFILSNDNSSKQPPTKSQPYVSEKAKTHSSNKNIGGIYEDSLMGRRTQGSNLPSSSTLTENKLEKSKVRGIEYTEPSIGTENILSVPMIRWCLREQIRLDYFKGIATANNDIVIFNRYVDNYNKRCGNYRYRQGDLSAARRDVEKERATIFKNAGAEVDTWGKPPNNKGNVANSHIPSTLDPKLIKAIQEALRTLGYNPGVADGIAGLKTISAIKLFQRKVGLEVSGEIDANFIEALKNELEKQEH